MPKIMIEKPSYSHKNMKTIFKKRILIEAYTYMDIKDISNLINKLTEVRLRIINIEKDIENLSDTEKLEYVKQHPELFEKDYIL